jgi:hypothetical protein
MPNADPPATLAIARGVAENPTLLATVIEQHLENMDHEVGALDLLLASERLPEGVAEHVAKARRHAAELRIELRAARAEVRGG